MHGVYHDDTKSKTEEEASEKTFAHVIGGYSRPIADAIQKTTRTQKSEKGQSMSEYVFEDTQLEEDEMQAFLNQEAMRAEQEAQAERQRMQKARAFRFRCGFL